MRLLDDSRSGRQNNERLARLGLDEPMGYVDGTNRYEFELDDPVNGLDPTGLWRQGEGDTIIVEPGDTPGQIAQDLTGSSQNWQQVFPGLDDPTRLQPGPHNVPNDIMEAYRNRNRPPTRPASRPTSRPTTNPTSQPTTCPTTQGTTQPSTRPNLATKDNIDELARVLMSEASIGNGDERRGVGNTILNRMRRNGTSSVHDITRQGAYARNQDPTQQMRDLAQQMLEGQIPDNTNGATHFYSPRSMNPPNSVPYWVPGMTPENVPNARDNYYRFYRAPGNGPVR